MYDNRKIILRKQDIFDLLNKGKAKGSVNFQGIEFDTQDEFLNIDLEVEE